MPARAHVTLDDLMRLRGRARGFSLLPHQPPGGALAGRHTSRLRGRGLDFMEMRHYQDGDDVRAIDWRATARLREPYVRVYTEERDRIVLLLVDQRISMFFGSKRATKSVAAAEAAALGAWRVVRAGDRVAAIAFDDRELIVVRPARGAAAAQRVLSEVARLNAGLNAATALADDAMLNRALGEAARLAAHDWLVVLISDAVGADETTRGLVGTIAAHNDIIAVFVFDPLETALPPIGSVVLAAGPARLQVDTRSGSLRRGHAEAFAARREAIAAFGRHRAIPVIEVCTDTDPGLQIRAALAGRRAG
ncbi:MAG: DUF58 domain-containing protein [Acetobacteraceae bacterium]|nr:DUF58 domain-containing protein [Acetobacteraceae bacterium]